MYNCEGSDAGHLYKVKSWLVHSYFGAWSQKQQPLQSYLGVFPDHVP